jgi:hypothetical protein
MTTRRVVLAGLASALLVAATAPSATAIPAFARKYQISCSTCHSPFPRLKPYGDDFAAAGFRMPDPSQEPPRATIETGDPTLKLNRDLPLAIRIDGFGQWTENAPAEADTQFPWVVKLLSGGPISKSISYYLYAIIEEGDFKGVEDAYLQFSSPLGLPLDLLVGQFQVCDPLFKRELRLERFDYQIYKTHVGLARVDLTYDRGIILGGTLPGKIDAVFQLVNGNGIEAAQDLGTFDTDSHKNLSLRLARDLGKKGRLGVFGYWGREDGSTGQTNETTYFGPDLVLNFGTKWQLNAQYLERRDDNPRFLFNPQGRVTTRGGFGELHFLPKGPDGPWALSALYNRVDSDDDAADYESVSVTLNRLLARNVRLALEAGRDIGREKTRVSVGIVTAF